MDDSLPPQSLPWIEKLVQFDTTSRYSNLGLIETVRDYLKSVGLSPYLIQNADGTKANLFVTLPARSGAVQGGIVLSGHTDVVPVQGQAWTSDPFSPEVRNGRLYGRGTCDMKGFLGVALAKVPLFLSADLQVPVHLALAMTKKWDAWARIRCSPKSMRWASGPTAASWANPRTCG